MDPPRSELRRSTELLGLWSSESATLLLVTSSDALVTSSNMFTFTCKSAYLDAKRAQHFTKSGAGFPFRHKIARESPALAHTWLYRCEPSHCMNSMSQSELLAAGNLIICEKNANCCAPQVSTLNNNGIKQGGSKQRLKLNLGA